MSPAIWHMLAHSRLWAHSGDPGRRSSLQGACSLAGEIHHKHHTRSLQKEGRDLFITCRVGLVLHLRLGCQERPLRGGVLVQYVAGHPESWMGTGKGTPGRGNSTCKGPEGRMCLECSGRARTWKAFQQGRAVFRLSGKGQELEVESGSPGSAVCA